MALQKKIKKQLDITPMYGYIGYSLASILSLHPRLKFHRELVDTWVANAIQQSSAKVTIDNNNLTLLTQQERVPFIPVLEKMELDPSKILIARTSGGSSFSTHGATYGIIALDKNRLSKPESINTCAHEASHIKNKDADRSIIAKACSPLASLLLLQGLNIGTKKLALHLKKKHQLKKDSWRWYALKKAMTITDFCANSVVANLLLSTGLPQIAARSDQI